MKTTLALIVSCLLLSSCYPALYGPYNKNSNYFSTKNVVLGSSIESFEKEFMRPSSRSQRFENGKHIEELIYVEYMGDNFYSTTVFRFEDRRLVSQDEYTELRTPDKVTTVTK